MQSDNRDAYQHIANRRRFLASVAGLGIWSLADRIEQGRAAADVPLCKRPQYWARATSVIWLAPDTTNHRALSIGSWIVYALGRQNQRLPGYVVLNNTQRTVRGPCGDSADLLPAACHGTVFCTANSPPCKVPRPPAFPVSPGERQAHRALIQRLSDLAPATFDSIELSRESAVTRCLYGIDHVDSRRLGTACLLARRLVQRGVRFVQVECDGPATDVSTGGLLTDLQERGLLASTLVVRGGNFHGAAEDAPLAWMTGAGLESGVETGVIGWKAVADPASLHDLHATVLHLLGIDHKRLSFVRSGRRHRPSAVDGDVLRQILA